MSFRKTVNNLDPITGKPIRNKPEDAGLHCPQAGFQLVSKVCHRCEFYKVMRGKKAAKDHEQDMGEWIEQWACTLSHQHMMMAGIAAHVNEQTTEIGILKEKINEAVPLLGNLMKQLGHTIDTVIEIVARSRIPQMQNNGAIPLIEEHSTNGKPY